MKELVERQTSHGGWLLSTIAVLLSTTSAFAFLAYFAMRSTGDLDYLLDEPQHRTGHAPTYWLIASLFCLIGTIMTTTLALPRWGLSRSPRFIGRFALAAIFSTILTVLVGLLLLLIVGRFSSGTVY